MTQQLLLTILTAATILATIASATTARRLYRYRRRTVTWACLNCGHTETGRARNRREAWTWIGATMHAHAHAHHTIHTGSFGGVGMTYTVTMPPEWERRQQKPGTAQPKK